MIRRPTKARKRRRRYAFVDLFCGAGGLAEGFRRAGLRPVFAADIDEAAAKTYEKRFGHKVHTDGVEKLKKIPVRAQVVIGGPPCVGFSRLGKMSPTRDHKKLNGLWRHYLRIVRKIQPLAFVVENVPEFLRSMEFKAFERLARRMGFRVASGVLDAAEFGVPQKRRRAFIFGMRGIEPVLPEPTGERATVRQTLRGLPIKPNGKNLHVGRNPKPLSIERYKCIPAGGNRFDLVKKRPDITPKCWLKKRTGSTDVFGRLPWEGLAPTIRTEFFKPEKGRYLHPEAHRAITLREGARLQSFPDGFKFFGSMTQIARQIGNAVPPQLAKAAAKALLQRLPEAEQIMRRRRKSRRRVRRRRRVQARSFRKAA